MRIYAGHLTDIRTGVAKPIGPRLDLPERPVDGKNIERLADEHHPMQGARVLSKGSLCDKAARHSRVQWTLYEDHHRGWHGNNLEFFAPKSLQGRFKYIALMAALCLTDEAISFTHVRNGRPKPELVPLNAAQRALMWERGDIRVERPVIVGRFLTQGAAKIGRLALHTGYDHGLIKRFKDEPDDHIRPLMRRFAELTANVTGLRDDYRGAKEAGFLPPDSPSTAKDFLVQYQQVHLNEYSIGACPAGLSPVEMVQDVFTETKKAAA